MFTVAIAAHGSAHAGLVSGAWDPEFGSFLPGLSWQVRASLLVPNSCSNQPDGDYGTASGPCQITGNPFVGVNLRLFDNATADAGNFFQSGGFSPNISANWDLTGGFNSVTQVRVQNGQIIGFTAGSSTVAQTVVSVCDFYMVCTPPESFPTTAGGNLFYLTFGLNGPILECQQCRQSINDPYGTSSVFADNTNLSQFVTTFLDDEGTDGKVKDNQGRALGARLNGSGQFLGLSDSLTGAVIPEPTMPALVLVALSAAVLVRRRRG